MNIADKQEQLKEPFTADQIDWKLLLTIPFNGETRGLVAPYVKSRAIQDRLDRVVGVDHWQSDMAAVTNPSPELNAFTCKIGIYDEKLGWVWKSDGAGGTDYETVKGGCSNALKRAASQWSIGRYLYYLDDIWTNCVERKKDKYVLTRNAAENDLNGKYNNALRKYMDAHGYSQQDIEALTSKIHPVIPTAAGNPSNKTNPRGTAAAKSPTSNKTVAFPEKSIKNTEVKSGKIFIVKDLKQLLRNTSVILVDQSTGREQPALIQGLPTLKQGAKITNLTTERKHDPNAGEYFLITGYQAAA